MKKYALSMFTIIFMMISTAIFAEGYGHRLQWQTNYEEAVRLSRASGKPILILFTGSDWCTWCIKLEEEALATPEFAESAGDRFIFVKLDFPINTTLPPDLMNQNKRLQRQFNVTGFPTIILVDPQQQQIGSAGYRPGGGKQYANYLLKMVEGHTAYRQKMQNLSKEAISGTELRHLYEHASECCCEHDATQIATLGIESDQKHFFLIERYKNFADQGRLSSDEAKNIRKQLLSEDPGNLKQTFYQVALIDFEASCKESTIRNTPEATVSSLVDYIERFGEKDKENLWRLQMIISQVYFEQDRLNEALKYAQSSYQSAPSTVQPEIAIAIKNIQTKLKS